MLSLFKGWSEAPQQQQHQQQPESPPASASASEHDDGGFVNVDAVPDVGGCEGMAENVAALTARQKVLTSALTVIGGSLGVESTRLAARLASLAAVLKSVQRRLQRRAPTTPSSRRRRRPRPLTFADYLVHTVDASANVAALRRHYLARLHVLEAEGIVLGRRFSLADTSDVLAQEWTTLAPAWLVADVRRRRLFLGRLRVLEATGTVLSRRFVLTDSLDDLRSEWHAQAPPPPLEPIPTDDKASDVTASAAITEAVVVPAATGSVRRDLLGDGMHRTVCCHRLLASQSSPSAVYTVRLADLVPDGGDGGTDGPVVGPLFLSLTLPVINTRVQWQDTVLQGIVERIELCSGDGVVVESLSGAVNAALAKAYGYVQAGASDGGLGIVVPRNPRPVSVVLGLMVAPTRDPDGGCLALTTAALRNTTLRLWLAKTDDLVVGLPSHSLPPLADVTLLATVTVRHQRLASVPPVVPVGGGLRRQVSRLVDQGFVVVSQRKPVAVPLTALPADGAIVGLLLDLGASRRAAQVTLRLGTDPPYELAQVTHAELYATSWWTSGLVAPPPSGNIGFVPLTPSALRRQDGAARTGLRCAYAVARGLSLVVEAADAGVWDVPSWNVGVTVIVEAAETIQLPADGVGS
jgi:hypothetical protein